MAPRKHEALITRYPDGACSSLVPISPTQLALGLREREDGDTRFVVLDLTRGTLSSAVAEIPDRCGRLGYSDVAGSVAAVVADDLRAIELRALTEPLPRVVGDDIDAAGATRARSRLLRTISRTGRAPLLRLSDDGRSLFYSAGERLVRVDVATAKVTARCPCFCRVTHVAEWGTLLVAHNKEGLLCLLDARDGRARVFLRVTAREWVAFREDGAWDASSDAPRGVEVAWSDARSVAFVPGVGFGVLPNNALPMVDIEPATAGRTPGLLALALRDALGPSPAAPT